MMLVQDAQVDLIGPPVVVAGASGGSHGTGVAAEGAFQLGHQAFQINTPPARYSDRLNQTINWFALWVSVACQGSPLCQCRCRCVEGWRRPSSSGSRRWEQEIGEEFEGFELQLAAAEAAWDRHDHLALLLRRERLGGNACKALRVVSMRLIRPVKLASLSGIDDGSSPISRAVPLRAMSVAA